ncbi:glycosyltransferase family 4 protein [Gallibacterium anatis]|uniref:glycosyltransferase family 4 protein n=1 Tax=Gallibacterium anatis TaxID=750 RepID=UPI00068C9604|nr:glycosyltransferase family 4 protein [Gallibacterium anatis]
MKIVFLSYLHGFGGAEKQIIMLSNAMAEKGHNVILVSISANNLCYELSNKVKYIFLSDRKSNYLKILHRFIGIRKILNSEKPDVVVNFWFQSAYLTALMRKSITGKIVYSERGDPGDKEYSGILGIIRKLTLPRIDGFVFQSKGARDYFSENVKRKSKIILNPISFSQKDFPCVSYRRKVIVSVGRLHPQKNQKLLINAFFYIKDKFPDYTLEIYGDGYLKQDLEKYISKLGLEKRVVLKGTSKSIASKIIDASLFVLSSDYEGLPNVLIEAMVLGIPCISTDCRPGGAREIIDDGVNGFIVPRNDAYVLSKSMVKVLKNPRLAEKFSFNSRYFINKYEPCAVYNQWEEFFKRLIGN